MNDFVHLYVHSDYSLLDSTCRIDEVVKTAAGLGFNSLALTDIGGVFGAVEFFELCKKQNIKPIIGSDILFTDGVTIGKFLILVENETGYKNLCRLLSDNSLNDKSDYIFDINLLFEFSKGLICVNPTFDGFLTPTSDEYIAGRLKETFKDRLYLGLIRDNGVADDEKDYLDKYSSLPLLALSDVRYLKKTNRYSLSILRSVGDKNDECGNYLRSSEEMISVFSDMPGAIENTVIVAEKCTYDFDFDSRILPLYPVPEEYEDDNDMLEKTAREGFDRAVVDGRIDFLKYDRKTYLDRIDTELDIIREMGFSSYFLIVADYVNFAKRADIPVGPGRGSGAGSLVAFLVGITEVDPVKYDLLFESFLNPERTSMPDFDIDFCNERRDEVIEYVKNKYGRDKVSQIITFGTFGAKESVRDAGRFLKVLSPKIDKLSKCIPKGIGVTLDNVIKESAEFRELMKDDDISRVVLCARQIEGLKRHSSKHAAGIIITDKPIYEYLPLYGCGEDTVSQFDMNSVSKIGLLKFDFLGLRYLTLIKKATDSAEGRTGKKLSFDIDDKETYKLISSGRCRGLFQLESEGISRLLKRMSPDKITDIMTAIALYRPGPMASINDYLDNRENPSRIKYEIPALEPILKETYGCIVYQEQVLEIFREIAGYSYAHADVVRRAISKKKKDILEREKEKFIEGVINKGGNRDYAVQLFEKIEAFSNYGFKKSHAAAYSFISFETAFLKCNYPSDYFSAIMSLGSGDSARISEYIKDAGLSGIGIESPDINKSEFYTVPSKDGKSIIPGFSLVRGMGNGFSNIIVSERAEGGDYKSYDDFVSRISSKTRNALGTDALIKCGFFDSLGENRKKLSERFSGSVNLSGGEVSGQIDLFTEETKDAGEDYTISEKAEFEINLMGFSISDRKQGERKTNIENREIPKEKKLYIRFTGDSNEVYKRVIAFISIFSGNTGVVIYNAKTGKYSGITNLGVTANDFVIKELSEIVGEENIVYK